MNETKEDRAATRLYVTLIIAGIVIVLLGGFASAHDIGTKADDTETITVFAAAGSMVAINEITRHYSERTGAEVIVNYASSSVLAKQIESGAEFDIYLSANPKWMDYVQSRGFVDAERRRNLMADRLVLIAPTANAADYSGLSVKQIIEQTNGPVSIGDPSHVPCGMYAKQALTALGCWEKAAERLVPAANVRNTQTNVEIGECSLGLVYEAGARLSDDITIVHTFDTSLHQPIRFSVAAASDKGSAFLSYLDGFEAQTLIVRSGFSLCEKTHLEDMIHPAAAEAVGNQWQALWVSLKVALVCTLLVAVPGILLGTLLGRKHFFGDSVINAIVHLPLVIPPVVTGYLALMLLGKNSLMGGWLYSTFGVSIAFTWAGAVLVAAIMGFPLLVRSVKTATEMIDQRYSHAANTLGAGPGATFFTITLPLASPGVLAGLILAFARSLGEFGATATFAGNIPGKTQTLSLAIFNFTQIPDGQSAAMKLVGISVLLSMTAMLGSEYLLRRSRRLSEVRS